MNQKILHIAKLLIKEGKVKKESESTWSVDGEIVRIHTEKGRSIITCSCKNCSRFCNENTLCSRKIATILYISNKGFYNRIDKLIEMYKIAKDMEISVLPEVIINELEDIKYFK